MTNNFNQVCTEFIKDLPKVWLAMIKPKLMINILLNDRGYAVFGLAVSPNAGLMEEFIVEISNKPYNKKLDYQHSHTYYMQLGLLVKGGELVDLSQIPYESSDLALIKSKNTYH